MFKENGITASAGNCHNLLTVKKEKIFSLEDKKIQNSKNENLLGVITDNKLWFSEHVNKICDKATKCPCTII